MKQWMMILGLMVSATALGSARLVNGEFIEVAVAANMDSQLRDLGARSSEPVWATWLVDGIPGGPNCCDQRKYSLCNCSLSGDESWYRNKDRGVAGPMLIAVKFDDQGPREVRTFGGSCEVDAEGMTVYQMRNVTVSKSLDLLEGLTDLPSRRLVDGAMAAIAHHDDPGADEILTNLAAPGNGRKVREQSIFWLGEARGRVGFEVLRRLTGDESTKIRERVTFALHISRVSEAEDLLIQMAQEDPSGKVRGQAIFWLGHSDNPRAHEFIEKILWEQPVGEETDQAVMALSQMSDDRGLSGLIRIAREHPSKKVRGKAMFWLGQKAGKRAAETLVEAVEEDPEIETKEAAVFALSQMGEEGIDHLIRIARDHSHPEIRKKAFFWLGQSGDERALALLESILLEE